MTDDVEEEIDQARREAEGLRAALTDAHDACELELAAWLARTAADMATSTVTRRKASLAQQLGVERVRIVKRAVDDLNSTALPSLRRQLPPDAWPDTQIAIEEALAAPAYAGAPGLSARLTGTFAEAARRTLGDIVGRALVDAGFDNAGPSTREQRVDWEGGAPGQLRYPYALDPDASAGSNQVLQRRSEGVPRGDTSRARP